MQLVDKACKILGLCHCPSKMNCPGSSLRLQPRLRSLGLFVMPSLCCRFSAFIHVTALQALPSLSSSLRWFFFLPGISADTVLREFGEYFFEFCKRSGYDHMLRTLGGNLYEFIENLDALHSYLSLSYQASPSRTY